MHTLGLSFIVTGHRSVFVIEIAPTSNLTILCSNRFSRIFPELFQVRICTCYMEVDTGEFEPHLDHEGRKLLIINQYYSLHRK